MSKRLSIEQIAQMKVLVKKGVAPEDIARQFNVAVSSVHNYKARFKTEGLSFPNVRGKRPVGDKTKDSNTESTIIHKAGTNYRFVVNGVSVEISAQAKSVNIGKDSMEINF